MAEFNFPMSMDLFKRGINEAVVKGEWSRSMDVDPNEVVEHMYRTMSHGWKQKQHHKKSQEKKREQDERIKKYMEAHPDKFRDLKIK